VCFYLKIGLTSSSQANVVVRVDENLHVHHLIDCVIVESKDALKHNDIGTIKRDRFGGSKR